jgi:hypothetical protein
MRRIASLSLCGVYERGVAQFVEQDDIVFRDQRRNRPERSGISATETKRSLSAFPFGQRAIPNANVAIACR